MSKSNEEQADGKPLRERRFSPEEFKRQGIRDSFGTLHLPLLSYKDYMPPGLTQEEQEEFSIRFYGKAFAALSFDPESVRNMRLDGSPESHELTEKIYREMRRQMNPSKEHRMKQDQPINPRLRSILETLPGTRAEDLEFDERNNVRIPLRAFKVLVPKGLPPGETLERLETVIEVFEEVCAAKGIGFSVGGRSDIFDGWCYIEFPTEEPEPKAATDLG